MSRRRKVVPLGSAPRLPAPRRRTPVPEAVLARLERERPSGAGRGTRLRAATRGERIVGYVAPELYDAVRLQATLDRCTVGHILSEALELLLEKRRLADRRVHRCTDAPSAPRAKRRAS